MKVFIVFNPNIYTTSSEIDPGFPNNEVTKPIYEKIIVIWGFRLAVEVVKNIKLLPLTVDKHKNVSLFSG